MTDIDAVVADLRRGVVPCRVSAEHPDQADRMIQLGQADGLVGAFAAKKLTSLPDRR